MKKTALAFILAVVALLTVSCTDLETSSTNADSSSSMSQNESNDNNNSHTHDFKEWTQVKSPTCTSEGEKERYCSCGEKQTQTVEALAHDEVIDAAVAATCTTDGKTEGKHCSKCNTVLIPQTVIPSSGHKYNNGKITTQATCNKNGIKTFTCTVNNCGHSYTKDYSLPTYTATELYDLSVKFVGEIVTYDKSGAELALGTGFVISSDGKIVTNYHVIDGAYSANITINNRKYTIASVLAYDENIDLAVLKVNATGLTAATICKKPVSVGTTVYAIGSSRGMTNTYSQGIITYANRVVDGVSHIQHDASITHGNSGGPLINVYGEVIGINTWGISDSQNLNFAVFTSELDNLTYGSPLTLAEFYLKECDVFEKLKNHIVDNGMYDASENCYSLTLGTSYPSDYSAKYTRKAYYYVNSNEITLDFLIDDGDCWVYFVIDENVDGSYYWSYFDHNGYKMSGTLYSATYDNNTLLGYSSNNISSSTLRNTVRELASTMISTLCSWIDADFKDINVSAEDLGFYYY